MEFTIKKLTTKEFIDRSIDQHKNKYDYSISEYTTSASKIDIICFIHGFLNKDLLII